MTTHRMAILCSLPLAVALAPALRAQTPAAKFVDSARVEIDRAVLARDSAQLVRAEVLLDRALVVFPNDPWLLHYRGYAAYRHSIFRFMAGDMPSAKPIIDRGIADLEASSGKLAWPETFQLLAVLTGFQIAVDPSRGQELGMQVGVLSSRASTMGPNNPRVLRLQAIGAQRTPPEYGGGADRARDLVKRALTAFDADRPPALAPAWGRDEAVALLKQLDTPGGPRKP
jgi:hypothetical protein